MTTIRLKYVASEVSRHGRVFYYFRRRGQKKIRLPDVPGSAEFMAAYSAALAGKPLPLPQLPKAPTIRKIEPATDRKSFGWLCQQYIHSPHFKALDDKTRKPRVSILNQLCDMPVDPDDLSAGKIGVAPFAELPSKGIRRLRDLKADTPAAANNWLKTIKALFKWAVDEEYADHNPAKDVPKLKEGGDGFHTWTLGELSAWEAFYPVGTKARLALALLLYTGCRRADVVDYGPEHIKDGWLTYTQNKNRNRKAVTLSLPVLKPLAEIIAASEIGANTFLLSEYGESYTIEGFGRRFRKWAKAAGIPHCTPHGLRKAGAVRCAEGGATANQLMAIFGWSDIKQAERYTRAVSQKTLAREGMENMLWPEDALAD